VLAITDGDGFDAACDVAVPDPEGAGGAEGAGTVVKAGAAALDGGGALPPPPPPHAVSEKRIARTAAWELLNFMEPENCPASEGWAKGNAPTLCPAMDDAPGP
jgi:hypothetical protein